MKRTLLTALLPLATTSLVVAGGVTPSGAVADTDAAASCVLPTTERAYTRDLLTYRLTIDLTDCDWWDGAPVQLDGYLERSRPAEGGEGIGSSVLCSAAARGEANAVPETEEHMPKTPLRFGLCAVEVSIEHPSPEVAHYLGEITFPWQEGRRTVSFNALCGGNAAGCIDLPLNPMTSLAPFGDAIGGA